MSKLVCFITSLDDRGYGNSKDVNNFLHHGGIGVRCINVGCYVGYFTCNSLTFTCNCVGMYTMNVGTNHWISLIFDGQCRHVYFFDSFGKPLMVDGQEVVRQLLKDFAWSATLDATLGTTVNGCALQNDNHQCGVWALQMEAWFIAYKMSKCTLPLKEWLCTSCKDKHIFADTGKTRSRNLQTRYTFIRTQRLDFARCVLQTIPQ